MIDENVIKCRDGWKKLYKPVIEAIFRYDDLQDSVKSKIGVAAVKNIDGELCIVTEDYLNTPSSINDAIMKARIDSRNTCEFCGSTKDVGTTMNYEFLTCCEDCWNSNVLPNLPKSVWKNKLTNQFLRKEN